MLKRFSLLAFSLVWFLALNEPAGSVEVAKVTLPQLSSLQWEMLRQAARRSPQATASGCELSDL
jgi:hypothetical protein